MQQFKYLGAQINSENKIKQEIQLRIAAGNRAFFALLPIFRTSDITRVTKLKIYKTLIRPVVTYGCQTWTMTKEAEETLLRFERRILRKIFGPIQEDGLWRARYNFELKQRMDVNRIPKKIYQGQIEGRRTRGRPRQRWADNIEEDERKILKIQNWKARAQQRDGWRQKLREAQVQ